jgi:hypothetical protein
MGPIDLVGFGRVSGHACETSSRAPGHSDLPDLCAHRNEVYEDSDRSGANVSLQVRVGAGGGPTIVSSLITGRLYASESFR